MLANFVIIFPIFTIMIIGYLMGRSSIFPKGSGAARSLTTFVWYIAIPALIFKLLASNRFPAGEDFLIILGYYLVLYIIYFVSTFLVAPQLKIPKKGRGIFAFSCVYGNLGFIGIPVIESALGNEGLRILLMIITLHLLTLLPITTLITELAKQNSDSHWKIFQQAITNCLKNPVVISLVAGLSWSASGLEFPQIAARILDFPAGAAAPVGLFAVGLSLSRVKLSGGIIDALLPVIFKMALLPLGVYCMMTYILQVPTIWVNATTLAACMPTGLAAYTLSEQFAEGEIRTASTIMIATLVSAFTLMIAVSVLI